MSLNTKVVYQLDNEGYFFGITEAHESPLNPGTFHIPSGAITIAPPELKENEIPFWNGKEWTTKPDFSAHTYYHKQTKEIKRFKAGEEFDSNYTAQKPLQEEVFQKFTSTWVIDEDAKSENQKSIIRSIRNSLLSETDKYFRPDFPGMTETKLAEIKTYSQYLRDYTEKDNWFNSEPLSLKSWKESEYTN